MKKWGNRPYNKVRRLEPKAFHVEVRTKRRKKNGSKRSW